MFIMLSFLRLIKTIRDKYGLGFWYWKTTPSNLRQTSIFLINRPAGNPSSRVALARGKTREQTGFRLKTSKSVTPAINRDRTTQETRKMNWSRSSFIIFFSKSLSYFGRNIAEEKFFFPFYYYYCYNIRTEITKGHIFFKQIRFFY